MWGGRFAEGPAAVMREINASIPFDKRLWQQDIIGSIAHVEMLGATGIIGADDAAAIKSGLEQIRGEYLADGVPVDLALEDIHMTIESRLTELIGPVAGRLHTARSRNDQVATSFRLWVRDAIEEVDVALADLRAALIARAEQHADTIMPGFTHLQVAQPVTLGHHLLAYVEMFGRDSDRFLSAQRRLDECPLGVAALAGTGFANDRYMTAKALGFSRPTANSMDSVSDRDFAIDYLMAAATDCTSFVAVSRRDHHLGFTALWLCEVTRCVVHRKLDHAAKAQSRCRRTGARPYRTHCWQHECADDDDEGAAACLFKGYAKRQAAGVRGA